MHVFLQGTVDCKASERGEVYYKLYHRSSAADACVKSASYRGKDKEKTLLQMGVIIFLLTVLL